MKKTFYRLPAFLLVLCLTLSLCSGAVFAAEAKASAEVKALFEETIDDSGFAPEYCGSIQLVEAEGEGLAVNASLKYTKGVKNRTTLVMVQAIDAEGKPLENHPVHFVQGIVSGSKVQVTYQEPGCQYFAMMPVQHAIEPGHIVPLHMDIVENDHGYTVFYKADLTISDDLALICAYNKADRETLKGLRFTCYLEDALLEKASAIGVEDYHFENPSQVFEVVEVQNTGHGVALVYKLGEEELDALAEMDTIEAKEHLQQPMHMNCDHNVSADVLKSVVNSKNEIYTYGRVEISYVNGDIPGTGMAKVIVPAVMEKVSVNLKGNVPAYADPAVTGVDKWLNTADHKAFMKGDTNGNFRPNDSITRAEVATIFYRLLKNQNVEITTAFVDVANTAWYAAAVNTLASMGIVNGVGDNKFEPERNITRAEFATICSRFAEKATGGMTFVDVPVSHWAYDAITTAAAYGWVNGVGNGMFEPDRSISRAEAATIVNRMLGRMADQSAVDAGAATQFPDVTKAHWAWYNIGEATTDHDYTVNTERTEEIWK